MPRPMNVAATPCVIVFKALPRARASCNEAKNGSLYIIPKKMRADGNYSNRSENIPVAVEGEACLMETGGEKKTQEESGDLKGLVRYSLFWYLDLVF